MVMVRSGGGGVATFDGQMVGSVVDGVRPMVRWVCHRRVLAGETGEDGLSCFEGELSGVVVRDGGGGVITFDGRMPGLVVDGG